MTQTTSDYLNWSSADWTQWLLSITEQTDPIARHYFTAADLEVDIKDNSTPVSQADIEVEKVIRSIIATDTPGIDVLGEEFEDIDTNHDIRCIIDPIDGTENFVRGIPLVGTLLAIEKNKKIIAGVVSSPLSLETWSAADGQGSMYRYHDHDPRSIQVSSIDTLTHSQLLHGSMFGRESGLDHEAILRIASQTYRQRGIGDFLMHMWVAMGCGECAIDSNLAPWDLAPLGIIVTEAGGHVTNVGSSTFSIHEKTILSSNGHVHEACQSAFKDSHI